MTVSTQNAPAFTQEDVTDVLLDFAFLPCPKCRTLHNNMDLGNLRLESRHEYGIDLKFLRVGMKCRNGHKWTFKLSNVADSVALNCLKGDSQ